MPSAYLSFIPDPESAIVRQQRRARVRPLRVRKEAEARPAVEGSPLHSAEALGSMLFVASMAACWIAVASTATAPILAMGEFLTRAAKVLERA